MNCVVNWMFTSLTSRYTGMFIHKSHSQCALNVGVRRERCTVTSAMLADDGLPKPIFTWQGQPRLFARLRCLCLWFRPYFLPGNHACTEGGKISQDNADNRQARRYQRPGVQFDHIHDDMTHPYSCQSPSCHRLFCCFLHRKLPSNAGRLRHK